MKDEEGHCVARKYFPPHLKFQISNLRSSLRPPLFHRYPSNFGISGTGISATNRRTTSSVVIPSACA